MNPKQLLSGLTASLLLAGVAFAHHSAAAFFDLNTTISLEGVVTAAKLANPHTYYRVTTDDGVDWAWESAGTWTALAKQGWSGETLPMGSRVRLSGTPSISDRPIARYSTIASFGGPADDVMILVELDVFGRGRPEWFRRLRELGTQCDNGVTDCTMVSRSALETMQAEFGGIGVWSDVDRD